MLATRDLSECKSLVERSFGSFLASADERKQDAAKVAAERELAKAEELLGGFADDELAEYVKLQVQSPLASPIFLMAFAHPRWPSLTFDGLLSPSLTSHHLDVCCRSV